MATDIADPKDREAAPTFRREFRVSDAMILVAGMALGLADGSHLFGLMADMAGRLFREAVAHRGDLPARWLTFWIATHDSLRNVVWYGFQAVQMPLWSLTLAFIVLRLRRPRPPLRSLVRQPGTVAGLAIVFGLFWGTGILHLLFPGKADALTTGPFAVGLAVALGWTALGVSRRGKPDPGWLDRLGRVLGVVAIATALVGLIVFRI